MNRLRLKLSLLRNIRKSLAAMVSWIVVCIAISALSASGLSFPVIEEHQEIEIPETVGGHEEILDHSIGFGHELHGFEPKQATSYQSFHLESKNPVPIVIKTVHPPTIKHFSSIGSHESFGHGFSEIEPLELKHHGF